MTSRSAHRAAALFLHGQVMAFMAVGREREDAVGAADRGASKLLGAVLFVVALAVVALPVFLDFLPGRVALKSVYVSLLTMGLAGRFWSGQSALALAKGVLRCWLPTGLLVYMYILGAKMMTALMAEGRSAEEFALEIGICMTIMAILGLVTSWVHAGIVAERPAGKGDRKGLKVAGLRFYALVWVAFVGGGLFMIAYATELAEWFFVDVLGW